MRKSAGVRIREIKHLLTCELWASSPALIVAAAAGAAVCGCLALLPAWEDLLCCALILPHLTPPAFLIFAGRVFAYLLLGGLFGFLIGCRERAAFCACCRGAILLALVLLCELLWVPLLYSLCLPFFALFDLLLLLGLVLLTLFVLHRRYLAVSCLLALYLAWLLLRFGWCFALLSVN